MYEVIVRFANEEKVTCIRDTFSKAKWWANEIVRSGSLFCKNKVTEYSKQAIGEKEERNEKNHK